MQFITVNVISPANSVKSPLGDQSGVEAEPVPYDGCLFAPRSSLERSDSRTPAVITAGSIYCRGDFPVTSVDRISISGVSPAIDGDWQIEGDPGYWGVGVEVAVERWK